MKSSTFYFLMKVKILAHFQICIRVPLIKESIQKQLLTEQMFFEIDVLKNFAIFRGKLLCWGVFLIKLQVSNFPVNIAKFIRTGFFIKYLWWLLLKIHKFPRKTLVPEAYRFIFLLKDLRVPFQAK